MNYKTKLLTANKPTVNGRIYTDETIKKIYEDSLKMNLMGQLSDPRDPIEHIVDLSKISFKSTLSLDGEGNLWADIKTLNTPKGKNLENFLKADMVEFTTLIEGSIEKECVNYEKLLNVLAYIKE